MNIPGAFGQSNTAFSTDAPPPLKADSGQPTEPAQSVQTGSSGEDNPAPADLHRADPSCLNILSLGWRRPHKSAGQTRRSLTLEVSVGGDTRRRIKATEAADFLRIRPTLAEHACRQKGLGLFADKIVGCSLPHLLEHLSIDYLVQRCGCQVAGNTRATQILLNVPENYADDAIKAVEDARLLILQTLASHPGRD